MCALRIVKILAMCLLLCGCASQRWRIAEGTYQALNAMDFAQTVTIAREPSRYWEHDFPTANLIGRHPTEAEVEAYWACASLAHLGVSLWLAREARANGGDWRAALIAWEAFSIGWSAYNVANNAAIGLKPFGARDITPRLRLLAREGPALR